MICVILPGCIYNRPFICNILIKPYLDKVICLIRAARFSRSIVGVFFIFVVNCAFIFRLESQPVDFSFEINVKRYFAVGCGQTSIRRCCLFRIKLKELILIRCELRKVVSVCRIGIRVNSLYGIYRYGSSIQEFIGFFCLRRIIIAAFRSLRPPDDVYFPFCDPVRLPLRVQGTVKPTSKLFFERPVEVICRPAGCTGVPSLKNIAGACWFIRANRPAVIGDLLLGNEASALGIKVHIASRLQNGIEIHIAFYSFHGRAVVRILVCLIRSAAALMVPVAHPHLHIMIQIHRMGNVACIQMLVISRFVPVILRGKNGIGRGIRAAADACQVVGYRENFFIYCIYRCIIWNGYHAKAVERLRAADIIIPPLESIAFGGIRRNGSLQFFIDRNALQLIQVIVILERDCSVFCNFNIRHELVIRHDTLGRLIFPVVGGQRYHHIAADSRSIVFTHRNKIVREILISVLVCPVFQCIAFRRVNRRQHQRMGAVDIFLQILRTCNRGIIQIRIHGIVFHAEAAGALPQSHQRHRLRGSHIKIVFFRVADILSAIHFRLCVDEIVVAA